MTDRPTNRSGNGQQRPKRDPSQFVERFRNRDKSDIEAHLHSHERGAIDQHLK